MYSTVVDPAYLTERLAALGGNGANLANHSVGADGVVSYRLRHGVAGSDLPGPVRTLLGGDLMLDRDETWRPDPSGGYRGTVKVTLPAMPGELGGTMRLTDTRPGSELVIDGSVGVPIPFVGGRIEETVGDRLMHLLDSEDTFTQEWLDKHQP